MPPGASTDEGDLEIRSNRGEERSEEESTEDVDLDEHFRMLGDLIASDYDHVTEAFPCSLEGIPIGDKYFDLDSVPEDPAERYIHPAWHSKDSDEIFVPVSRPPAPFVVPIVAYEGEGIGSDASTPRDILELAVAGIETDFEEFLCPDTSWEEEMMPTFESDEQLIFRPTTLGMPNGRTASQLEEDVRYLHIPEESIHDFRRFARIAAANAAAAANYDDMIHNPYIQALRKYRNDAQACTVIPSDTAERSAAQELASRREALAVLGTPVSALPSSPPRFRPECFEMASPRRPVPQPGDEGCIGGDLVCMASWNCHPSHVDCSRAFDLLPNESHSRHPFLSESRVGQKSGLVSGTRRCQKRIVVDLGQQPSKHAPVNCFAAGLGCYDGGVCGGSLKATL